MEVIYSSVQQRLTILSQAELQPSKLIDFRDSEGFNSAVSQRRKLPWLKSLGKARFLFCGLDLNLRADSCLLELILFKSGPPICLRLGAPLEFWKGVMSTMSKWLVQDWSQTKNGSLRKWHWRQIQYLPLHFVQHSWHAILLQTKLFYSDSSH